MSIFESYEKKISELKQFNELLDSINFMHPEKKYLEMIINTELLEYQRRLESLSLGKLSYRCSFCNGFIKEIGIPIIVGDLTLCNFCKISISQVMTTNKAEEEWGLFKGAIKQDCRPGGALQIYKDAGLVFKSGKFWQIHRKVMLQHYGEPKDIIKSYDLLKG
ncbi:MAG: pPPM1a [Bacilli bacterium]|nr:pPPM1a [Bacilli bacterium]